MKVLVFGLVCIVWVQKACSAPKWSNDSATQDDLLTGYENGFCWMDCDWYDDPLYYSHIDVDHGMFLLYPFLENQEGFEEPGNGAPFDDGGLDNPRTDLDSGSRVYGNIGFSGTGLDDVGTEKEKEAHAEDETGLPPWKRLAFGLVAGTVLVGILWKWVTDFVDRALEIPMERPPPVVHQEPEFQVVQKVRTDDDIRNPEVVLGSELLRRSRFFHLLLRQMESEDIGLEVHIPVLENAGILERTGERERRLVSRRTNSALQMIPTVVVAFTTTLLESATERTAEVTSGQPDKAATQKVVLEPPSSRASTVTPPYEEKEKDETLGTDGKTAAVMIERTPSSTGHPWNFPIQPTQVHHEDSPASVDLKKIIEWNPERLLDCSGKAFQDEAGELQEDRRSPAGASLQESTKGKKRMWWGCRCFRIPVTSRVQSGPSKTCLTWKILCSCLRHHNDQAEPRKKATKRLRIFKFKC